MTKRRRADPKAKDEEDSEPHAHPPRARARSAEPAHLERAAMLFRALADPARLRLLELLMEGEACVSELAEASQDGLSTTSQRLRLLRTEALVSKRREGKHIHYALADRHVAEIVQSVLEHVKEPAEGERRGT